MRRRHRWGRLVRGQTVRVLRTAIWAGLLGLLPGGPIGPWGGWSDVDCLPNSGFGLLRPVSAQEPATAHGIDAQQVRTAIDRAVRFVKSRQNQPAGNWSSETGYTGGVSALCTLALLNAGVPLDDPVVRRGLHYVRRPLQGRRTYTVSLQTMVLCTAEPEKDRLLIRENVQWLQRAQIRSGPNSGGWSYDESPVGGDPSNTQFAMLALFEAERIGMEVAPATWRQALGYWTRRQQPDGSWNYPDRSPSGSMTCAGVASVVIALGQLSAGDARVVDGQVECCGPQADNDVASRGLDWLGKHFSVSYNPGPRAQRNATFSQSWHLYYLYALERVGRMTGNRFIGDHDWYREGAEELINRQNAVEGFWQGVGIERNRDISTALGLLFLSKGRRPILMAKYDKDPQGDWNRHRSDIAHLTRIVEQGWKQDLTWQTVRGSAATLDDLLQAPVIYLCGRDSLQLTAAQKEVLRQYVEHGGFIFAESYCGGEGFDRDFRRFVADVFPESPLRLLPPDHPIWYAEREVSADQLRPLYGVEACCRTSIVYCPGELSCYWELAEPRRMSELPAPIRRQCEGALAIGVNVLTYATNRQLRDKLDSLPIPLDPSPRDHVRRGMLRIAKIRLGGGSDDAPSALGNAVRLAAEQLQSVIQADDEPISLTSEETFDYPVLFLHGRRDFQWSAAERTALRRYLENGGFLIANAICGSDAFSRAFRRELERTFPEKQLQPIPPGHPMWTDRWQGYDLSTVQIRIPRRGRPGAGLRSQIETGPPQLEGLELEGRLAVAFSSLDLSCALESPASVQCHGYLPEDAAKIFVNLLLFAMQQ